MKTSINWLKQIVDVPWSPTELAEKLTSAGLEVEGIVQHGAIPDGVVVCEILARAAHPNADKLSVCEVSTGSAERLQIVCGAPNCDVGKRVPLATVGTVFGEEFRIKRAKLRGVESCGMLCSARELGLGDDQSGLLELPASAPLGRPLAELIEADTVIDWEVTPNRPDCLSHIGVAREIAAVRGGGATLRLPSVETTRRAATPVATVAAVEVQAPDLCPRYIARVIRNVTIAPSPEWLQRTLRAVGVRPINNIVDITNYVMLECGQPLHAFDCERLAGRRIVVRRARAGETLTTLDGRQHRLSPRNLLIADAEKGVALAGVMGGANSEISADTTTVLLESAAFNAGNIRATAKTLGIGSESSYRFERGVDIEMTEFASIRAAALMCELAGGELLDGALDVYAEPYVPRPVSCRFARVNQLIGVDLAPASVCDVFARLGLGIASRTDAAVTVSVPAFRLDLQREADLIEEVARLFGLDNVPARPAAALVGGPMSSDTYYPIETARAELLALGLGETMTYSLLGAAAACAGTGVTPEQLVVLANPLSSEATCMRPDLLPCLLQTVAHNVARNTMDLALFELGRVIVHAPDRPEERWQVGIALSGRPHPERFGAERAREYDFFDLKGLLESWLDARRLPAVDCVPARHPGFDERACATLRVGGAPVGVFGHVAATLTAEIRLKHPLFIALVELDTLRACEASPRRHRMLPQFPAVGRDVALVAGVDLPNQTIVDTIRAAGCAWLERVELFDVYEDETVLGPGRRSLAYSLTYRHDARTLTDDEVNQAQAAIRERLAAELPVELR